MLLETHDAELFLHLRLTSSLFLEQGLLSSTLVILSQRRNRLTRFLNIRQQVLQRFKIA